MPVLTDRTPAGEAVAEVPPALVYEMDAGHPIYYRGYRSVLGGHKQAEEIVGSSYLQSLVVSTILRYLMQHLPAHYRILTSELGLLISEKSWRAVDIAIYHASQLQGIPLHNQYLAIPPQVVIEVDTKADLVEFTTAMDYYYTKTDDLLNFGVQRVIWVFTDARKILSATADADWITRDWTGTVTVVDDLTLDLAALMASEQRKGQAGPQAAKT